MKPEIGLKSADNAGNHARRTENGEALLERLTADLTAKFGRDFPRHNLHKNRQFILSYPELRPTASGESNPPSSQESDRSWTLKAV